MKEYKLIAVCPESDQTRKPVTSSIRDFFTAPNGGAAWDMTKIELLMRQMSEDGWEVISSVPTPNYPHNGEILITFERFV